eukprot:CAMPEP_0173447572 /NCGR_PEP_ID=MMETSP1357-20121228/38957_1 /TAXON_ID=77926 /ORGANISM="Hemiselmis rufescens, Strain PCC563" /LENGTH=71 /DNA_ID=CAMNT_0014413965 /DNA_START=36 /DNA_END=247 /DNA_ORIENTATION=-
MCAPQTGGRVADVTKPECRRACSRGTETEVPGEEAFVRMSWESALATAKLFLSLATGYTALCSQQHTVCIA